ncbi:MAG TPA: hypothetical protein VGL89_02555, partial [Candidatus Koribacter sp.]
MATILACIAWFEHFRDDKSEYEVYSAYLSEGINEDAHDWSVDAPIEVVVQNQTAMGTTMRWWWLYPFDQGISFGGLNRSTRFSFWIRNVFRMRIKPRIQLPPRATVLLEGKEQIESNFFVQRHPHTMGTVLLSGVGFNRDCTQAV